MKIKKHVGNVLIVGGAVLLGFGFYGNSRVESAEGDVETISSLIPRHEFGGVVDRSIKHKIDYYRTLIKLCFIGGIAAVAVGGYVLYISKKR